MPGKTNPNQTDLFVADTRAYRYLVVLNPGFHITEKVKFFRQKLNALLPLNKEDLVSKPHISLCYLDSPYKSDQLVIDMVEQALSGAKVFDLCVNGVDYWQSGTFFMKVENPLPVIDLVNRLRTSLKGAKVSAQPHITIARKLRKPPGIDLNDEEFQFQATSPCYSVTILKQLLTGGPHPFEILEKIVFRE